jgi:glyceraldehyde 3-phosphate dehydrogenase
MIPTKTGAVTAISKVMPELRDKFDGLSVRVPTPNVSILDIVVSVGKPTTVYEINEAIKASTCRFLGYTDEPMVSIDFMGDPRSSIVDGGCTKVIQDTLVKVMAWYDNEWGYSNRILDLILYMDAHKIVY